MSFIKTIFFLFSASAFPVLCATGELQRIPDSTIIARYKTAYWGAAAAGKRLSASARVNSDSFEAAEAKQKFCADIAQLIRVIDELYFGYRSAAATLDASLAQLDRSEAQLAHMKEENVKRLGGSADPAKLKRFKNFRAGIVDLQRTIAAQRIALKKQQTGLMLTIEAVIAHRKRLADMVSGPIAKALPAAILPQGTAAACGVKSENVNRPAAQAKSARTAEGTKQKGSPAPVYKRVAPGQTVLGIALANGITLSRLVRLNPSLKKDPDRLLANAAVRVR